MRLREVVELPEYRKHNIVVVGHYNTDGVIFAVLARRGEKLLPVPKLFYLIENGPENPDPNVDHSEIDSILRHFGYFQPISTFQAK
jgi:hypothetical protein